jgi:hypothetical protein
MGEITTDLETLVACGGEAISITASGGLVDIQTIGASAWEPSGSGLWYTDVRHRLPRTWPYPTYQIYNFDTGDVYWPANIRDLDVGTIRLFSNDDTLNLKMTIVGEIFSSVISVSGGYEF